MVRQSVKTRISKSPYQRGQRHGWLTLLAYDFEKCKWEAVCDCGKITFVAAGNLKSLHTQTCGCLKAQRRRELSFALGHCGLPRGIWSNVLKNARHSGRSVGITIEHAWEVFERQQGKCALSGVELVLVPSAKKTTASLDRIDSSIDYLLDNVQWVHKVIQLMKGDADQCEFIEFACKIALHQETVVR